MPRLKPPVSINVPMVLTWARIAMIPIAVGVFYVPTKIIDAHWINVIACLTFVIAATTDALDGYLARILRHRGDDRCARRYEGWATDMGAFLDPVADKLIVSMALIALVGLERLDMLVAFIIIGREITVSALREWMAKVGESGRVKVNWFGKIKTIAQMTAIPMLLWWDPITVEGVKISVSFIGTILIWIAAVLTIYSMYVYLRAASPAFNK